MSRPRPKQALFGAALAAAAACALPSAAPSASAKPRVLHYAIPLPKLHGGKVVLLEIQSQLPPNMGVGGTVAVVTITNLRNVPCYVRAAQGIAEKGPNLWRLYLPVATPRGQVVCERPAPPSPASKVLVKVEVRPPLSSYPLSVRKLPLDACKLLQADLLNSRNGVALTGFDMKWRQIARLTITADRACK